MARVALTDAASADESGILTDLQQHAGQRTVVRYRRLFRDFYVHLAAHPAIGSRRPALGQNIRIGVIAPDIIIYRYYENDQTIMVMRIVHGRRRMAGEMLGDV